MPFEIVRNDVTRMAVDAIVNAGNNLLADGGGVTGAIYRAAGPELGPACAALGGCATGQAKITPGFRLPARYIIHTVGPVWQGGGHGEEALLRSCYLRSLELARAHQLESVAFPLISAGIYGYPRAEAVRVATGAIRDFLLADDGDMLVYLVVFDRESFEISGKLQTQIAAFIDDRYADARRNEERRAQYDMNLYPPDLFDLFGEGPLERWTPVPGAPDPDEELAGFFSESQMHPFDPGLTPSTGEPAGPSLSGTDWDDLFAPEPGESDAPPARGAPRFREGDAPSHGAPRFRQSAPMPDAPRDAAPGDAAPPAHAAPGRRETGDAMLPEAQTLTPGADPFWSGGWPFSPGPEHVSPKARRRGFLSGFAAPRKKTPRDTAAPDGKKLTAPPEDELERTLAPLPSAAAPRRDFSEAPLNAPEKRAAPASLEDALKMLDESFSAMVLRKIDERGMTDPECYKRANLDRKLFSKLRADNGYKPKKQTALALAIALELPIAETRELLMKAGYALSHSDRADVIVEFFIQRRCYDIFEINAALYSFDQVPLGGRAS